MRHTRPDYHLDQIGASLAALAGAAWFASYATWRVQGRAEDKATWLPLALVAWLLWLLAAAWFAVVAGFALWTLARSLREQWQRPAPVGVVVPGSGWGTQEREYPRPWQPIVRDVDAAAEAVLDGYRCAAEPPPRTDEPVAWPRPDQPPADKPKPQQEREDAPTREFLLPDELWTAAVSPNAAARTYGPNARHAAAEAAR